MVAVACTVLFSKIAPRVAAELVRTRGARDAEADARNALLNPAPDEHELMARIARGDASAYRAMAERYLPRIASYAERLLGNRAEAEDVAQDTFLRLWTEAARFTPKAKASTWLYRIAHNLGIDRIRRRRPHDPDAVDRQPDGDRPSGLLSRKETSEQVAVALSRLPERQRAAITLVHYEGLGAAEAAAVLEVSVEALESLLSRGRSRLRELLSALEDSTDGEAP